MPVWVMAARTAYQLEHICCTDASLWTDTPWSSFERDIHVDLFFPFFAILTFRSPRYLDYTTTRVNPSTDTITLLEQRDFRMPMCACMFTLRCESGKCLEQSR